MPSKAPNNKKTTPSRNSSDKALRSNLLRRKKTKENKELRIKIEKSNSHFTNQ